MESINAPALILLGSNIDRHRNLPTAIERLCHHPALQVEAVSSIYESGAVGGTGEQPCFSNAALRLRTTLAPVQLRQLLRQIEAEMGRVRSEDKYAPRPIDLDIVLLGNLVTNIAGTTIPDPDLERFPHIAIPIAEIAPEWRHPLNGRSLHEISMQMEQSGLRMIAPPPLLPVQTTKPNQLISKPHFSERGTS